MTLDALAAPILHLLARASLEGAIALAAACLLAALSRSGRIKSWWLRLAHLKLAIALLAITPLAIPLLPRQIPTTQSPPSPTARANVLPPSPTPLFTDERPPPQAAGANVPPIAPEPQIQTAAPLSLSTILFPLWLLGATLTIAHLARTFLRTRTLRRRSNPVQITALIITTQKIARSLRLPHTPPILLSSEATSPFLTGFLHPAIILPTNLATAADPRTLELILTHELAHLARRDLWWNLLPALLSIPFFFHPLLWLARREWLAAQEIACDQLTLATTNSAPADYARTLLDLITHKSRPGLFAAGMGTFTTTKRRMKAMTHPSTKPTLALTAIALAAALGLIPWRLVAQPTPDNPPPVPAAPETGVPRAAPVRGSSDTQAASLAKLEDEKADAVAAREKYVVELTALNARISAMVKEAASTSDRAAAEDALKQVQASLQQAQADLQKIANAPAPPTEDAQRLAADRASQLQVYQQLLARREAEMANSATAGYHAVISSRSVTLAAAVDGAIRDLPVVDGQHVKPGDLLVALDSRDQEIAVKLAEIDLKSAKKALDRLKDNAAVTASNRDQAEVAEQRAEIALEKAQSDLDKTFIRCPIDGLVKLFDVAPGAFVAKGSPIVTVLDTTKSVSVHVTADDARVLHVGQSISVQGPKGDLNAEVTYISPEVDSASGTCLIKALLKSGADEFRSGQFVNISFPRN